MLTNTYICNHNAPLPDSLWYHWWQHLMTRSEDNHYDDQYVLKKKEVRNVAMKKFSILVKKLSSLLRKIKFKKG